MRATSVLPLLILMPLLLAACTSNQSSVEKNARHMAYQLERIHFDPNTRPLTADNIRLMSQFLGQFYEFGKKDRAAGLTVAQAQQQVENFSRGKGPFSPDAQTYTIINRSYDADQPDKRIEIMKANAIQSYWDGYHGRA